MHTPGPWHHGKPTEYGLRHPDQVKDSEDNAVCMVFGIPQNSTLEELLREKHPERWDNRSEGENDLWNHALRCQLRKRVENIPKRREIKCRNPESS